MAHINVTLETWLWCAAPMVANHARHQKSPERLGTFRQCPDQNAVEIEERLLHAAIVRLAQLVMNVARDHITSQADYRARIFRERHMVLGEINRRFHEFANAPL